jgi:DNA replication and repair protein RecF
VLDVLDEQLAKEGTIIFQKREAFLNDFLPIVQKKYADISQQAEPVTLNYETELHTIK